MDRSRPTPKPTCSRRSNNARRSSTAPHGEQIVADVERTSSPAINAYIAEARLDPTKLMPPSTRDRQAAADMEADRRDRRGVADRRHLRQGRRRRGALGADAGGVRKAVRREGGRAQGWEDFREHNDPEAPTTVSKPFPYETGSPFSTTRAGDARPGSVSFSTDGTDREHRRLRAQPSQARAPTRRTRSRSPATARSARSCCTSARRTGATPRTGSSSTPRTRPTATRSR